MEKGKIVYYARCLPGIYDMCELVIRTVADNFFVGVDKRDKRAYLFKYEDIGKIIFDDRADALAVLQIAESKWRDSE